MTTESVWIVVDQKGNRLTKPHSTRVAAMAEAFEKGLVVTVRMRNHLRDGLKFSEVAKDQVPSLAMPSPPPAAGDTEMQEGRDG